MCVMKIYYIFDINASSSIPLVSITRVARTLLALLALTFSYFITVGRSFARSSTSDVNLHEFNRIPFCLFPPRTLMS